MAKNKRTQKPLAPVAPPVAEVQADLIVPPVPVEQGNAPEQAPETVAVQAPEPVHEPVAPPPAKQSKVSVEPLGEFAARMEAAGQPLAVCRITHPDAVDGAIHEGTYAGIRLHKGPKLEAQLSDGSTLN